MGKALSIAGFLACGLVGAIGAFETTTHLIGNSVGRPHWAPMHGMVADYAGVNVDHAAFRNMARYTPNLQTIMVSDVLLYGSSKGMLGLRASVLNRVFGSGVRFYNVSLAYGEGLPFLPQIVLANGLHDRIAIMDMTDIATQFAVSKPGIEAMDMGSAETLTRMAVTTARYFTDWLLSPELPAIGLDSAGFHSIQRVRPYYIRSFDTGDDATSTPAQPSHPVSVGKFDGAFDPFGGLRDRVFAFLRCRRIEIMTVAVPFSAPPGGINQYDPAYTKRVSDALGFTHLSISPNGLSTRDWVHLSYESSFEFTSRVAADLARLGAGFTDQVAKNRERQELRAPACETPGITTPARLLDTGPQFYTIDFRGSRFRIPVGTTIDWESPHLERVPGVTLAP